MADASPLALTVASVLVGATILRRATTSAGRGRARSRLRSLGGPGRHPGRRSAAGDGPLAVRFRRALADADVDLPPDRVLRLWVAGLATAGAVGAVVGGAAVAALSAGAAGVGAPIVLLGAQGRRARRADAGLPAALDDLARALRAGESPTEAMRAASAGTAPTATRTELAGVVDDVDRGVGLVDALTRWSARRPSEAVRLTVAALAIGMATGGARSRALEQVAATLRDRQVADREATALATQARASALVIALAPLAFAFFTAATDPRSAAFLTGSPVGLSCLAAGLALDAAGAWWMHRIVRPGGTSGLPNPTGLLP